jgi:predicted Zn-dependent protease
MSPAARVLLDQANYWRSQNQLGPANAALDRLLAVEPTNAAGLALKAELAAEQGDRAAARAALARLQQAHPDDPRLSAVAQTMRLGAIDPAGLAEARRLAQTGHNAEAVAQYKRLFQGGDPPPGLALEYYQTLAGTDAGWESARANLARIAAAKPQDAASQLAYAEVLTYRPGTRREGIDRLAALSQNTPQASAAATAWRHALEWLPQDQGSLQAYEQFLSAHPGDERIADLVKEAGNPRQSPDDTAGRQRTAGFEALKAGQLTKAAESFQAALQKKPDDADALGGLGLVRLRQNNGTEARSLLARAIAADPAHKDRWSQALAGASAGEAYAAARALLARGEFAAAERQIRSIIARGGDTVGAQMLLADAQARGGNLPGAETTYRSVLAQQPNNTNALVGLAQLLMKQGRSAEAEPLMARAQAAGDSRAAARIRAEALRQQATSVAEPAARVPLLRSAVTLEPQDPWLRLDYARALEASGRRTEAVRTMSELTSSNSSIDAIRAAALFAAETNRPEEAAALVARLPAAARTPEMRALLAQGELEREIRNAMSFMATSPSAARGKLLALAAQPDPTGLRGKAIAQALLAVGSPVAAREALATAQAATPVPPPKQRIVYAGVLLQAGDDRGARTLIHSLNGQTGLSAEDTASLNRLRAGVAVREADALNAEGRQAEAYDVLARELARTPADPGLNMALARLYARSEAPRKALEINQELLARDPSNFDARAAAVRAAVEAHDWNRADLLVRDALQLYPNDPRTWLISAEFQRARGNGRRALQDLRRAQDLRQQEIGEYGRGTMAVVPAGTKSGANVVASPSQIASLQVSPNPFRRDRSITGDAASGASDPMAKEIAHQIDALQEDLAPKVTLGPGIRTRTGTSGLDRLSELSAPVELVVRPFGRGKLTFGATPTFLSAGDVPGDPTSQASFGTGAFGNHPAPPSQHAEGIGLSLGYQLDWLKTDVGMSPLGFQQTNVLGGVEASPEIADGVTLRVVGERRAVTDSVLSYAGTEDPATGTQWGGVTRMRGRAQLEFSVHGVDVYAGGGYAKLAGTNVASNTEYELGTGVSYPIWRRAGEELRVGIDLVYFAYDKNLRFFSLGQGGYFSPQSYFAGLIPVHYTAKSDNLTWSLGGSLGYQTYNERSSPVFPNDSGLQSALVAAAASNPGIITVYPGRSASGLVGGVEGSIEYNVGPAFRIGGRGSFQHAGDWSEGKGMLFARYILDGGI